MTTTAPPAPPAEHDPSLARKGLKLGAIGLVSSVVIAIASTAPAYSLTSALGSVVGEVGTKAPVALLIAFIPMLFISYAYKALNNVDPDCGTSFTWVARAFGRRTGWITGWVVVIADVIVMANLAEIAGSYTFQLFGAYGLAESTGWTTLVGCVWILLMTLIAWIGIELSARTQVLLLSLELLILAIFAVTALVKVYAGHAGSLATHPSLSWFNPFGGGMSFSTLSAGFLAAVFIYWGWDSAVAANEETTDSHLTPGRAAVISTVVLLVTYLLVAVAAQAYAGVGSNGIGLTSDAAGTDALSGIGQAALGTFGFKLLVLAILSSSAASAQTTILPTARTTLSMAAYKALPRVFGTVHRRFQTPTVSTWAMGLLSIAFYAVMVYVKDGGLLNDMILALGLQIAFYYGLTGFASAWYFRRELTASARNLWLKGILPVVGGVVLFAAFFYSAYQFWTPSTDDADVQWLGVGGKFWLGIGAIVIGIPLMIIWNLFNRSYFRGDTMVGSDRLVAEAGEVPGVSPATSPA
ncbi:APC family permease [Rugosimonospora africana]|uniref:Putative amino acid permease n=1 Tax=Rugosimonospora africana TaxID=556532 RepID=A0A8J3QM67_9ACTN|nr:APC family permease [Rugosimonospora africana]GIH12023.1 putative amino acid permease [Rugosimonospora africana]